MSGKIAIDANDSDTQAGLYTLMNKNQPLIDFEFVASEFTGEPTIQERTVYSRPWFIPDLMEWARKRHAPKHRANIEKLLNLLGLTDIKSIIDFSKALSLTDTLWVNFNDKYDWEAVNLFDNPFDETIARIAFDGGMHGRAFSTTSPEITTDGAFAKCWVNRPDGIYLIKQGSGNFASNSGLEPYSEQYCSEILDVLGYNHVNYATEMFHGKLASSCKLLTSKQTMMLPLSVCVTNYDYESIAAYCRNNNMIEDLYRMVIFDYLVTNDDRHLNNVGVLLDADDFTVKGLAPIFDNGAGLLTYAVNDDLKNYTAACEYASGKGPVFYDNFYSAAHFAISKLDSAPIRKLLDFSFNRSYSLQLPEWRLQALEDYIRNQASCLLQGEDPLLALRAARR